MTDAYETWLAVLVAALVVAICWAIVWAVPALLMRRNDIADVAWGPIFPTMAMLTGGTVAALDWSDYPRATLVLLLAWAWALRLAWHIGRRLAGHAEDRRYATWRTQWGRTWVWRSLLQVFVLQACIAVAVAQPLLIAVNVHEGSSKLGWLDAIALVVAASGLLLEAVADRQLGRFVARKQAGAASGYLTTGVWAWSRHPNYAGDAIYWWGIGCFGVAGALDAGAAWLVVPAVFGAVFMTWFLRFVSGVPLTERNRAGDPAWDAYVASTPVFLPRPWLRPARPAGDERG